MPYKSSLLLPALVVLSACAMDMLSPNEQAPAYALSNGLEMQLSIDPTEIGPGEEFTATYSVRNTRAESVRLESLCNALAKGVVYRNSEEVGFVGSGSGCRTAISTYDIAAGETLEQRWRVKAAIILRAYPDGREPDIALAESGQYIFRAEPDVYSINGAKAKFPKVEQRIVVR